MSDRFHVPTDWFRRRGARPREPDREISGRLEAITTARRARRRADPREGGR